MSHPLDYAIEVLKMSACQSAINIRLIEEQEARGEPVCPGWKEENQERADSLKAALIVLKVARGPG